MNCSDFIQKMSYSDRVALIDSKSYVRYGDLFECVKKTAHIILNLGIKECDVICFEAQKDVDTVILFLSLMYLGVACCPVDKDGTMPPHNRYLSRNGFRPGSVGCFSINETFFYLYNVDLIDEALQKAIKGKYLNATSGSTGDKKYALATWENIYFNAKSVCETFMHSQKLVYLSLFSANMHICESFMRALFCGGTAVLVNNSEYKSIFPLIRSCDVNHIECVPSQLLSLRCEALLFDKPITVECTGGSLTNQAEHIIKEMIPGVNIIRSWGSAEGSGICLSTRNSSVNESNSIGRVLDGYESLIDEKGQLYLKGKGVVSERLEGNTVVKLDPFYATGDYVYSDQLGNYYILGRVSNMIKCAGENIFPSTIENALYQHESVIECVVVGVPDDFRGEQVVAWITIKQNSILPNEKEIKTFCQSILMLNQLIPKRMNITYEEVPKTEAGKADLKAVKRYFIGGDDV